MLGMANGGHPRVQALITTIRMPGRTRLWNNPTMPRLLIVLAAVCFGTTGTAQALGAAGASPVTVGEARIVVGALALQLLAWLGARGPAGPDRPRLAWPRSRAMWLASGGVAVYQVAFFLAVRTTGVAVGTVVALGSAPVVTGGLAAAWRQGRPDARWAGATALAGAGLAVLTLAGRGGQVRPLGVLLALAAAAGYATYTLAAKQALTAGARAETVMATCFSGGAALLSPVLLLLPAGWLATPRGAVTALWLGLVPTALAYVLFARGLRDVPAAEASTLTLAEPLTAAALGVLVLGEPVTPPSVVGVALLLAGLAVLALPARGRAPGEPVTDALEVAG
jgi:drug/metabolite transporter, DME family